MGATIVSHIVTLHYVVAICLKSKKKQKKLMLITYFISPIISACDPN